MSTARQRGCLHKRPYASQEEADAVIKDIRKAGKMARFTAMHSYPCRFCPYWHVGHNNRKGK